MTKLTKNQQRALESLKDSRVYVGNCSPDVMRTYDSLVRKGLAEVISENATGKRYAAVAQ